MVKSCRYIFKRDAAETLYTKDWRKDVSSMVEYPKAVDFQKAIFVGTWGDSQIPIYDVPSMHALNQLVGYVKHINAGKGTVLYRGQCRLYERVVPSIKHDPGRLAANEKRLNDSIDAIIGENPCLKFFGLRGTEVEGWSLYQRLVIEAVLQHYGAKTYSVDFVDNHWTALWFGLYEWNAAKNEYILRNNSGKGKKNAPIVPSEETKRKPYPKEPTLESITLDGDKLRELQEHAKQGSITFDELVRRNINRRFDGEYRNWKRICEGISQYNEKLDRMEASDHLFLFLYVAETNVSNLHGVYLGENCYTIDLRKSLPSTFLRPCSQHGWIVRGKSADYDFNSGISCVIRVNIDLAKEMLGQGTLLSQENFFPDETIDQGYNILLERQKGSRLESKFPKLLPPEMITDFGPKTK